MSFSMDLWEVEGKALKPISTQRVDFEERLEDWLASDPSLSGMDVLIIGRQVPTDHGGRIDLLGIDSQGNTVVFELKRGRTPRDVVAQVLDYATWVRDLDYPHLGDIAQRYLKKDLATAFREQFDDVLPEEFNSEHTLVVVAPELDESSERIVQYLYEEVGLAINVVFFNSFKVEDKELLGRAWLQDPEEIAEKRDSRRKPPWSGYWFVNVGEDVHRNWDDCRNYGFLSAGQAERYSRPLKKLKPGDTVFAYLKGRGYVGLGEVTRESNMISGFEVDGKPLLELPLKGERPGDNSDNPKRSEWVVGINWKKTFSREEAKTFKGVFAGRSIVCKLRHPETVKFVEAEFGVEAS